MHSWRVREKVLNIIEATTGGRVHLCSCKVGGVRSRPSTRRHQSNPFLTDWKGSRKDMRDLTQVFLKRPVGEQARLSGTRVLTNRKLCGAWVASVRCCGPAGCADMRSRVTPPSGYTVVRLRAPKAILSPVARPLRKMFPVARNHPQASRRFPTAEIAVKVTGNPPARPSAPPTAAAARCFTI